MSVRKREIIVDVDPAPTLRQIDMLFGRKRLTAKYRDPVLEHRPANRIQNLAFRIGQLDIVNCDAAFRRQRLNLQM